MYKNIWAIIWSILERAGVSGLQFFLTLVLARLLTPTDYGYIATLTIYYALGQSLIDSGMSSALIQKKNLRKEHYSSVFTFNIVLSIAIYFLLFILKDSIGRLYDSEIIAEIIPYYSLTLVINSFSLVHRSKLMRQLRFAELAKASMFSNLIGGLFAIWLAYSGHAFWSLVLQTLLSSFILTITLYLKSDIRLRFFFQRTEFDELFKYGSPLMLVALISAMYTNVYSFIIGLNFAQAKNGLYARSSALSSFGPVNLGDSIVRALFPMFSSIRSDRDKLRALYLQSGKLLLALSLSVNFFVIIFARDLILFLLTEKWIDMTPMVRVLAFSYIFYPLINLNNNALKVEGKTNQLMRSEVFKKILGIVLVMFSVKYGIQYLLICHLAINILDYLVSSIYVNKYTSVKVRNLNFVVFNLFATFIVISFMINYLSVNDIASLGICVMLYIAATMVVLYQFTRSFLIHFKIDR